MKKLLTLLSILILGFSLNTWGYLGRFHDGTGSRDSVWMNVATFDTLGFRSDADSVWFYRFYGTAVIDSTILTGTGERTGYYITGKRAFDGTNYGEYNVLVRWKIQGKYFVKNEGYTVFPDSVSGVGRIQTNLDKTNYQLASGQVIARADSVTGAGRITTNLDKTDYELASGQVVARADSVTGAGRISTNLDKTDYQLASGQVIARADSVTGAGRISINLDKTDYELASGQVVARADSVTGAGRLWNNLDKNGYELSSQGQANIWTHDTSGENSGWAGFFKNRLDADISSRLAQSDSGILARAPWDDDLIAQVNRRIRYADSLGEDITGSEATNPDTIANHVWIWNTRTLTSGAGSGANQVIIITKQASDSTPIAGVQVQILNYEETSTLGLLTTNPSGQAAFALDNATYQVRMFKPGWQFNVPESLVVSGNIDQTYYAIVFDPGSPPSAELCRVYGWIQDLRGQPIVGATVEAKISNAPLRYQSVLISPYYKTTSTDSDGYWYLDLYPNPSLTPYDTQYDFTIYIPYGTILKLKTTVPEQSSWELIW